MKKNFLVTTALNQEFSKNGKNFLLGKWCESHNITGFNKSVNSYKSKHHWTNKTKLEKDYYYINLVSEKILNFLTSSLNKIHNTNENSNYWRVIINPWLISYLTVLYSRWESFRIFFSNNKKKKFYSYLLSISDADLVPNNHYDFWIKQQTDEWNHIIFKRIGAFLKVKKLVLVKKKFFVNKKNINSPIKSKKKIF